MTTLSRLSSDTEGANLANEELVHRPALAIPSLFEPGQHVGWTLASPSPMVTGPRPRHRNPRSSVLSGSPPRSLSAPKALLLRLYGEKRANLTRFFAARLRSTAEAEDLVQDLYLKLQALGDIETRDDGSGLLFHMANNLMLDHLRSQARSSARDARWFDAKTTAIAGAPIADEPSAEDVVNGRQRLAALMRTLGTLPPKTAQAFSLHKLEGLSHAETAAAMGISRSAVEKHISTALKALMVSSR